ncbi:SDR family NAD(P)-dependent oxidoreductase [Micrococcoides hystricis]|uniref:SDR family NAD(P)-dependent oxidoreductase n=1 Tax=Micrococcoides hystricis TaxID=1572761 RepID=A0ABV6PBE2_9MICC
MAAASLDLPERVIVTGGTSGIGRACAELFAAAGCGVGIISRSQQRADAVAAELAATSSGTVFVAAADVADETGMQAAIDQLAGELGGVDALIVSAGIAGETGALLGTATVDGFRQVMETNVVGAFIAVNCALPYLTESPDGSIVLLGSDSGFVAVPGMIAYNASKGAIVQLTRALATEAWERRGIRVNSVAPSIVDTPMARHDLGDELMDDPPFPLQSPQDVAWSVAYLSSRQARAVNGTTLLSDFGFAGRSSFPA